MKTCLKSLVIVAAVSILPHHANANVVEISHYGLGEDGTVGTAASFYAPLKDDINGDNNIANAASDSNSVATVITTGLAAPGSTAALTSNGHIYWQNSSSNAANNYNLTDNFAIDLWVRPGTSTGTYLFSSANSSTTSLNFWATGTATHGTSLGGNNVTSGTNKLLIRIGTGPEQFLGSNDSTYKSGDWHRITVVDLANTLYYYLDGVLQDSAAITPDSVALSNLHLGAGPDGAHSVPTAAYDELAIWQFDNTDSLHDIADDIFATSVPTPAALPAGLALLALGVLPRRRA